MTTRNLADGAEGKIAALLQHADVSLDEVHRARLCGAIDATLEQRSRTRRSPSFQAPWGKLWPVGALATTAVAAVTLAAVVARSRGPVARVPAERPAPVALLAPYLYTGNGAERFGLEPASRLDVPAGARVRAAIGTRVRLTLVGPGKLSLAAGAGASDLELALDEGALFVDYDGSTGGVLRVRSPGAETTVVGTLFSVEVTGDKTRVAVARGSVGTRIGHATRHVASGTAWDGAVDGPTSLPLELARALAEHDASPPPPIGEFGLVHVERGNAQAMLTLDGRPLGPAPLVARVPAGAHQLGEGSGASPVSVDVVGGTTIHLDGRLPRPLPALRGAAGPSALPLPARPSRVRDRRDGPWGDRQVASASLEDLAVKRAPLDLDAAYAGAENDLRAGRRDSARVALKEIAARQPLGARAEAALLDLARIALDDGNAGEARGYLARLPEHPDDPALAEPAAHLRCVAVVRLGDVTTARGCLADFRRRHPGSAHDAEALALLASYAANCAEARPLLKEYLRRYQHGSFASDARERLAACCDGCR